MNVGVCVRMCVCVCVCILVSYHIQAKLMYVLTYIGNYVSIDISWCRGSKLIGGSHQGQIVCWTILHVLRVRPHVGIIEIQIVLCLQEGL